MKGGPWVAVAIWWQASATDEAGDHQEDEIMVCLVDGKVRDPHDQWTYVAASPIPYAEYDYLVKLRGYASIHAPAEPIATPKEPINHLKTPITFNKRKR